MPRRYIAMICVLLFIFLLAPQAAQPFEQDESIKERVKPAIEAGVEFLRKAQSRAGAWPYNDPNAAISDKDVIGATALAGIALMECNVPTADRQVQAAAKIVRSAALNLNYNYSMCLSVLFLDRLNRGNGTKHGDAGTIKELANRIARGQAGDGGWGYTLGVGGTDNSNTQFGIVALWVSRKYTLNQGKSTQLTKLIDQALRHTEQKFRNSQRQDGGWGYDTSISVGVALKSTGSMTCAGVLGLALFAGAKQQQTQEASFQGAGGSGSSGQVNKMLEADAQVAKARAFIISSLDSHISENVTEITASFHSTYFFWSLERAATLLHWNRRNGFDWFEKGANYLMKKQSRDGSWSMGTQGAVVDTSFVLLYLAQSNLLGSLTESTFDGRSSIGDGPTLPKDKKPEPKPQDAKEKANALVEKLVSALPPQQSEILLELTDAKGTEYTEALLDAITKLSSNASKEAAREALANRLRRLTAKSLDNYTQDPDRELRLAAAVAIRLKNDTTAAASLIPLLADQDIGVSTAALDSLKAISGQDFGKSVERWSRWLDKVTPKKP